MQCMLKDRRGIVLLLGGLVFCTYRQWTWLTKQTIHDFDASLGLFTTLYRGIDSSNSSSISRLGGLYTAEQVLLSKEDEAEDEHLKALDHKVIRAFNASEMKTHRDRLFHHFGMTGISLEGQRGGRQKGAIPKEFGVDQVYLMHWRPQAQRLIRMNKQFAHFGIKGFKLVHGMGKEDLTDAHIRSFYQPCNAFPKQATTPYWVSLGAKFFSVFYDILASGYESALVFENDACVRFNNDQEVMNQTAGGQESLLDCSLSVSADEFMEMFRVRRQNLPDSWDIAMVGGCPDDFYWLPRTMIAEGVAATNHTRCMNAFLISRRGCAKIIDSLPLTRPIDLFLDHMQEKKKVNLSMFWFMPQLMSQTQEGGSAKKTDKTDKQQMHEKKMKDQRQKRERQQLKCSNGDNYTMAILREAFPMMSATAAALNNTRGEEESANLYFPSWIQSLCPEVAAHFGKFPYFQQVINDLPTMTTLSAAHLVCSMSLARQIASSIGAPMYLYAGSHLGAIVHGGPIPWDDDVDLLLPYGKKNSFLETCNRLNDTLPMIYPDILEVKCHDKAFLAIKLVIVTANSVMTAKGWEWPFVDIFSYVINQNGTGDGKSKGKIQEVCTEGLPRAQRYPVSTFFPTEPYYFGGLHLLGPSQIIARKRYRPKKCVLASYVHRLEQWVYNSTFARLSSLDGASKGPGPTKLSKDLECCELADNFPFIYNSSSSNKNEARNTIISNGVRGQWQRLAFGPKATDMTFAQATWQTESMSVAVRKQWAMEPKTQALNLTSQIPNLDVVEVDNAIADPASCRWGSGASLRVVEFNAERGKYWLEASGLLKALEADVIILNEMDIGMARSDQQHTTRLLAHSLGMNYAWATEFVELTRGNKQEQQATEGLENDMGLHGNAILSKCRLYDPLVIRGDDIAPYFTKKGGFINAHGYEKRLGGRMVLLTRMKKQQPKKKKGVVEKKDDKMNELESAAAGESKFLVLGSTHTLKKDRGYGEAIQAYIGTSPAIIAGDQDWDFCARVGLQHVDNRSHNTWPASCDSDGYARGDIICSNLEVAEAEETVRPCVNDGFGLQTTLSDHAITYVSLKAT